MNAMTFDLQQERQQAHVLPDRLAPANLGVVRSLLEVMVAENEPVTPEPFERR